MKITQEEVVDLQTVLHIELEEDDMDTYLERGYQRVAQKVVVPGFRKGKAPRGIVERFLGRESLLQETLDFMLPEVTERAIAEQKLEPVGTPKLELLELEPVTLKATVAMPPKVDLGLYRDLRVEEKISEISEEDIQDKLQQAQEMAASWEPVKRPVKAGDMVTIDVKATVDGRTVLEESDAVYLADEESELPFPGFSENLVDMEVGVAKEFAIPISEEFADVNLAGKEAKFQVDLSEVKEKELPELDDEFAKGVGDGYETLAELRENLERELNEAAHQEIALQHREETVNELLKLATVELPPLIVEHELEHAVERRDQVVERLKIRMDDYIRMAGKTEEQIEEEMRSDAIERLERSYVLNTLAEREGLEVSPEEIDDKIQEVVTSGDEGADSLAEQDLDSEEVRGSIERRLLLEKTLDRLTDIAKGDAPQPSNENGDGDTEGPESDKGGENVDEAT